jgi:hypothetical protein
MPENWEDMTVDEKLTSLNRRIAVLEAEIADDFGKLRRRVAALEMKWRATQARRSTRNSVDQNGRGSAADGAVEAGL